MKRRIAAAALLACATAWGGASAQDFAAGADAAKRGDYASALAVWKPLAEAGDAASQYNLGMLYARGDGVERDYAEALRWFRAAAEQGRVDAQARVGGMYARGIGTPRNATEAARWLGQAAEQHHAISQYELGVLFANGEGVDRDPGIAYFWFTLASLQQFAPAIEAQAKLRQSISALQREVAESQVQQWLEERDIARPASRPGGSGG